MERRTFIETFGTLSKFEKVQSLNRHLQPSVLVLEDSLPYPGYYSRHDPDTEKPRYIFILTREFYSMEKVLRFTYEARKVLNNPSLDVTPCRLTIFANAYSALRARHFHNFEMVDDFIAFLRDEGVSFVRYHEMDEMASIEVQKLYNLEEILPGIYQDLDEVGERYITLPCNLDFGQLMRVTQAVKNNLTENNFDAALSMFYRHNGIVDAVRIFEPFISVHNLEVIQNSYIEQIRRLKLKEI